MTRDINTDFSKLKDFISDYELINLPEKRGYINRLSEMHKKAIGLLTVVAELKHVQSTNPQLTPNSLSHLEECCSDLGQSLFCWIHGAYKASNLLLRSGIETYVKCLLGNTDDTIFNEKSMYKLFDKADISPTFQNNAIVIQFYSTLKNNYKLLCGVVHSANLPSDNMISTLKSFPQYNENIASKFTKTYVNTIESLSGIFYFNFYAFIHQMHYKNQLLFKSSLLNKTKRLITDAKST